MRIAVVAGRFPVASETFVLDQVRGLLARGHDVEVYARQPDGRSPGTAAAPDLPLSRHVRYWPARPRSLARRSLKCARLLADVPRGHRAQVLRTLDIRRYGTEASTLRLPYMASRLVAAAPHDVVLCHFGPVGRRVQMLRDAGLSMGRLVTFFHGFDLSRYVRARGEGVYRRLLERGDLFLPVSRHGRRRLIELGAEPGKVVVHRMGVDCRRLSFAPRTPPPEPGTVRCLSVGRLVEKKGYHHAVEAVVELLRRGRDVEYTIVGEGPLRPALERRIGKLGAGTRIRLAGWKGREEVIGLLERSHLFMAPSVTAADGDQEGIPVALMEAMAVGVPVIGTRHAGIAELVRDGRTGHLVPEADVDRLAGKLERLLGDRSLLERTTRPARRVVERFFDAERQNDRLLELLRGLPGTRRGGGE